MSLHLINTRRLAEELADGRVSAHDQAIYLAASFIISGVLAYSFVVPPILTPDRFFFLGMWAYEFAVLVSIYAFGALHCLRRCRVEPERHFLIDFSCLYAPVSLTTWVIVWALYYLFTQGVLGLVSSLSFSEKPPAAILFLYNTRFLDVLRAFAVLGASLAIMLRIGGLLSFISDRREG